MHIVSRVGIGKIPPSSPLYLDVGGAVNFDSTLHVIGQTTVNSLISSQLALNSLVYESRIAGETNVLFSINRDGKIEWGAGDISIPDVNFYRSDINTLRTNGSLIIDQSLSVGDSTSDTATFTARISSNFDPSVTNVYSLGQDTLRWQNLWLSVKLTSVDGLFTGDLQVDNNIILGSSTADTLTVNAFVSSQLTPFTDNIHDLGSLSNRWRSLWLGSDLQVDGNTILGDAPTDTIIFNARAASSFLPSSSNTENLGSSSNKWKSLWLGSNLQVDGNTILGDNSSNTLTVNAFVSSQLTPFTDNIHDLGSLSNRWRSLWLGSDLQVDGNTILGDSPSDTIAINAGFTSPLNPATDNFYDFGTFDFRWKSINLGNNGVIVRNDNTDIEKVSLFFNASSAYLLSSPSVNLFVTTGSNAGILVDTAGKVGINYTSGLVQNFNVNGTADFSDTVYFSKASGYGLQVSSVAGIVGSIESANLNKYLNIGINPETEFINLGTGSLTKTINIGTGSGKTTINIGGSSDIININGTVTTTQTIESFVSDKTFTLNVGGLNNTAQNSGLIVEEADSLFLTISDPTWQSGNTVRYTAVDTGNIKVGSVVLISGFGNTQNNGQFTVTGLSNNMYFEVQNALINTSGFDELASGFSTNPTTSSKILVTSDRSGWDFVSSLNNSNYFRLSNLGANAELKSTVDGIFVTASALLPEVANTPIGSFLKPWDGFLNDLIVYGDTEIGSNSSNTLIINSITSFLGNIDSNIIPDGAHNLGSLTNRWSSVYANNLYANTTSTFEGIVNLGLSNSSTISVLGLINSSLVPSPTETHSLGTVSNKWLDLFVQTLTIDEITLSTFSYGSVLYINEDQKISEMNSHFFWNEIDRRLYLGQNTGSYVLDILKNKQDAIRIRNADNNSAIALRTSETIYLPAEITSNLPLSTEGTSVSFTLPVNSFLQTFSISTTKKISKISLQLSITAPPAINSEMTVSLVTLSGGIPDQIIATAGKNNLSSLSGFQSSYTDFVFPDTVNLMAGTYGFVITISDQADLAIDTFVKLLTETTNPYSGIELKSYDQDMTTWSTVLGENLSFTIYELIDQNTPVANKIEFTDKLEFGVNTYANVGNGTTTPVLQLTNTAINLLGAVSVNSTIISTSTYTIQPIDVIINVDTSISGSIITLPSAATKRLLIIKDIGNNASAANRAIELAPASNEYVEFNAINAVYVIDRDGESVTLQSDGISRWYII